MQRMTDVLSRMLNDPMTRAALSAGGEDSLDQESQNQDDNLNTAAAAAQAIVNATVSTSENNSDNNNSLQSNR